MTTHDRRRVADDQIAAALAFLRRGRALRER
jgi:hypothetical protein